MSRLQQERAALKAEMADVQAAIRIHGEELARLPNVLAVTTGYRFRKGRITHDAAVIVHVASKRDIAKLPTGIVPRRLGRVLVDVIEAGPSLQLRHLRSVALAGPGAAPEGWRISTELPGDEEEDPLDALAGPRLPYVAPAVPATEVDVQMTVVCHSSCDNGSRLLQEFFGRTQSTLVSTMYEFTAPHLMETLLESLKAPRTFEFIFDGKNKKVSAGDLTRQQVLTRLSQALGDRLTFAWAANAQAGAVVSSGFFPSAYHIKVSVRDQREVWLSSGNWKESGQPEVDPQNPPQNFNKARFEEGHNREWHVLIESPELSDQFTRFIRHDIQQALPLQIATGGPLPPDEVVPDLFVPVRNETAGPPVFHPPLPVKKKLRVMPLFTPDKGSYFDFVADLISKAKRKIYFENQSLSPSKTDEAYMDRLFLVLRDKARQSDIDVKIIVRGDYDPADIFAKLEAYKFPMDQDRVRHLNGVHTKGIIIDDQVVLIGSHNWTGQGTRENRDASLVFWDSEIIQFYTTLFEYDWGRATDELGPMPRIAPPGEAPPAGFVRVPWDTNP